MDEMSVEKWWGKTGETPRKTYPDLVSSTTKPTWSDRDANSGPQRSGGRRAPNRLRHEAAKDKNNNLLLILIEIISGRPQW